MQRLTIGVGGPPTHHRRPDVDSSAPDVVALFGSLSMRTCVLVNTHDEGVTCGSCGNVARMFNPFKVVRTSNYVCVCGIMSH